MATFIKQHFDDVISYDNLSTAWAALQEQGKLIPNYSKAHREQHEIMLEQLRAGGMNIAGHTEQELREMPMSELKKLMEGLNND